MHEFGFAYNIFKVAEATAIQHKATKITKVLLEIGELTLIVPELLKESFKMAVHGSIAEGAELVIEVLPGKIKCDDCGKISQVSLNDDHIKGIDLFQCQHCQSKSTQIIEGKKANVKNIMIQ